MKSGGELGSVCKKALDTKFNFGLGVLGSTAVEAFKHGIDFF